VVRLDPTLLYPITHRTQQQQEDLSVIRVRAQLVKARTLLVNTARGAVKSLGALAGNRCRCVPQHKLAIRARGIARSSATPVSVARHHHGAGTRSGPTDRKAFQREVSSHSPASQRSRRWSSYSSDLRSDVGRYVPLRIQPRGWRISRTATSTTTEWITQPRAWHR
jgi:hypothetical protein